MSQNVFFSDVNFWSKSDFSIKIELKNWVSGKYFFSRIWLFEMFCIRNLPERKIFNSKPDLLEKFLSNFHCAGKLLLQNLITFFLKISFQTLIFNEKVCYKVMPFKMSTQSEKLVVGRGANRVKTLFLRRDVFIEIWFLDVNWTENLIFRKKFVSTKWFFEKFFIENRQDKKTDQFVGKNFTSKSDIFFKKFHFKFLIFKENFTSKSWLLK